MNCTRAIRTVASAPPRGLVLLGDPVAQSMSPAFQNAALAHANLTVRYERRNVPAEHLDEALAACRAHDIAGNVTIPHTEARAGRAAHLSARARRSGAVNTFWWDGGMLVGHNTDVDGVLATIAALRPAGVRGPVVVLGSGGSAAAVLVALAELGLSEVHLVARSPARAAALGQRIGAAATVHPFASDAPEPMVSAREVLAGASLVINATPTGMQDVQQPVPVAWLGSRTAVFDLVYRREGTAWVHAARARGLPAEDGLRMLIEQGAAAFEAWFDQPAPRAVMWAALGLEMPAPDRVRG
ncbi:MAG: shikimate dehydrogenase family protein [Gemmatimonadaceae bacterium]